MKIAMISDVHTQWHNLKIPECDLLISSGDYSYKGERKIVKEFHEWLDKQPAKHIISCQGNHELWVERNWQEARDLAAAACPRAYFIDEGLLHIEGRKIWCAAITPWFFDWAYNVDRGPAIKKHWDCIPDDTEILVTHGPPYGILDQIVLGRTEHLGCVDLEARVNNLKKLKLHVFGHIHGGSGEKDFYGKRFVNASICNEKYKPVNPVREFVINENV